MTYAELYSAACKLPASDSADRIVEAIQNEAIWDETKQVFVWPDGSTK